MSVLSKSCAIHKRAGWRRVVRSCAEAAYVCHVLTARRPFSSLPAGHPPTNSLFSAFGSTPVDATMRMLQAGIYPARQLQLGSQLTISLKAFRNERHPGCFGGLRRHAQVTASLSGGRRALQFAAHDALASSASQMRSALPVTQYTTWAGLRARLRSPCFLSLVLRPAASVGSHSDWGGDYRRDWMTLWAIF